MSDSSGDRSKHFPAIEKKHGLPISHWLDHLATLGDAKYPEQIASLRENHGFSQAHANAVVMYFRGSTTSKRFRSVDDCLTSMGPAASKTAREIFDTITTKYPKLELVVAWNHPMLRSGTQYVFGVSAAKNHLTLNPFSSAALETCAPRLTNLEVNKKTFKVPIGWSVDGPLLRALVKARLDELA